VASVHPKAMPVILAANEYAIWLSGDFDAECALADAYPNDAMRIVPDCSVR
jgi:putative SOS response-associated peptidase YedK